MEFYKDYSDKVDSKVYEIMKDFNPDGYSNTNYKEDSRLMERIKTIVTLAYLAGETDGVNKENFNHEL